MRSNRASCEVGVSFILVYEPKPMASVAVPVAVNRSPVAAPARTPRPLATPAATTASTSGAANRRWSPRSVLDKVGSIGLQSGEAVVSCLVRDISRQGALLALADADSAALPDCFVLVFFNNRTRCEANCVIRWRRDGRVGVCFAGPVHTTVDRR
jgi:PilZ domain